MSVAKTPGGTIDGYLNNLDTFASNLASAVNTAYGDVLHDGNAGRQHDPGRRRARGVAVEPAGGTTAAGSNDIALARRGAARRRERGRRLQDVRVQGRRRHGRGHSACESNAQVLTDSAQDRRQSVSGVSMDEEMSNLVQFQRAYQASSRAMSTMDEMLDVLINRTGKVGL